MRDTISQRRATPLAIVVPTVSLIVITATFEWPVWSSTVIYFYYGPFIYSE